MKIQLKNVGKMQMRERPVQITFFLFKDTHFLMQIF